jgi:Spy/CpxP family protein refolding chaperone
MHTIPEPDPLDEAPLLRSVPRVDPFEVPEGFFDRFPAVMASRVAAGRPGGRVRLLRPGQAAWPWAAALAAAAALLVLFLLRPAAPGHPAADQAALAMEAFDPPGAWADDPYLIAQVEVEPRWAPGVQHDLNAGHRPGPAERIAMRILFPSFLLLAMLAAPVVAQPPDAPPFLSPEKRKELRAQKAAYITSRISLSPEEAQQFWPVYNKFDEETDALRRELGDMDRELRTKGDAMTDAEANALLEKELANRQKEVDLMRKFQADARKLIGPKRLVELGRAERDFHREVVRRFRERHEGPDGPRLPRR